LLHDKGRSNAKGGKGKFAPLDGKFRPYSAVSSPQWAVGSLKNDRDVEVKIARIKCENLKI